MIISKSYEKNRFICEIIAKNLEIITQNCENLVFIFVGTDANVGDSLGPLVGTLIDINDNKIYKYGSLNTPITAKEVPYIANFIKKAHPDSFIIVVDAALGKKQDIGQIKVLKEGIRPGLGVNKNLPTIGDASIIGIIGEKNAFSESILALTRLSCVYQMANVIKEGIEQFIQAKTLKNGNYIMPSKLNSL